MNTYNRILLDLMDEAKEYNYTDDLNYFDGGRYAWMAQETDHRDPKLSELLNNVSKAFSSLFSHVETLPLPE